MKKVLVGIALCMLMASCKTEYGLFLRMDDHLLVTSPSKKELKSLKADTDTVFPAIKTVIKRVKP